MRKWWVISLLILSCTNTKEKNISENKIENLIIITTDGLRWQEVFKGMDSIIAANPKFNEGDSSYIFENYWSPDELERRKKLMPFLWKTIVDEGQIYGNRAFGNYVDNANPYWFSYPGYSEIFTGYPDSAINSNDLPANPHITVLEYLNQQQKLKGKIAAFGAWVAFDRILNEQRSGIPVFSAFDSVGGNDPNSNEKLINAMLQNSHKPWLKDECLDVFTHYAAMEYLKSKKPNLLYMAYGETDEWAHAGRYRAYLDASKQIDTWLNETWSFIQNDPKYRNKTALFITVDHGRGDKEKEKWTSHNNKVEDSHEIWFAVIGPGIQAKGEIKEPMQLFQKQFAQTFARLLGYTYHAEHPIADEIKILFEQ